MNDINGSSSGGYPQLRIGDYARFIPEPKSGLDTFQSVARAVSTIAGGLVGIDPEYRSLIEKQLQLQEQMQRVSMESNLARTEHETEMTPIRNLRLG